MRKGRELGEPVECAEAPVRLNQMAQVTVSSLAELGKVLCDAVKDKSYQATSDVTRYTADRVAAERLQVRRWQLRRKRRTTCEGG
jgi:hypothetical protein